MLFGDDFSHEISKIPHLKEFKIWKSRLSEDNYEKIVKELKKVMLLNEVQTSSWIPGSNWNGSVFEPLYEACERDQESAAKFFGLILYQVVMDDEGFWGMTRAINRGVPIKGLTYFRLLKDPRE